VTISRGRRGIRIFTPDKEQLRENLTRSGHRLLALEFAGGLRHAMASALGPAAWLSPSFRPTGRRHLLPVKNNPVVTNNTCRNMSTKSPECYTTEPQARCLRVEISPGARSCCRSINSRLPNSLAPTRNSNCA